MSKIRVIVEIDYEMDQMDLSDVKGDLKKLIDGGTEHGKVKRILLECRHPTRDTPTPVPVYWSSARQPWTI